MSDWETEESVTCVVCPTCAFTFDADHTNTVGGGYSCPACHAADLEREVAQEIAKKNLEGAIKREYAERWERSKREVIELRARAALGFLGPAELDRAVVISLIRKLGTQVEVVQPYTRDGVEHPGEVSGHDTHGQEELTQQEYELLTYIQAKAYRTLIWGAGQMTQEGEHDH